MTMPTAEVNVQTELDQVEHWRAQELMRAGYAADAAAELASRHDIDLHHAVQLVERGCPAEVAVRILL
jgi:hypothetical protein